jgi:hypothetical protein
VRKGPESGNWTPSGTEYTSILNNGGLEALYRADCVRVVQYAREIENEIEVERSLPSFLPSPITTKGCGAYTGP